VKDQEIGMLKENLNKANDADKADVEAMKHLKEKLVSSQQQVERLKKENDQLMKNSSFDKNKVFLFWFLQYTL